MAEDEERLTASADGDVAAAAATPATRRTFSSAWDEALYVYDKLVFWFYDIGSTVKARHWANRMEQTLARVEDVDASAKGCECRALIAEVRGDWGAAAEHRAREISRMQRMRELAPSESAFVRAKIDDQFGIEEIAARYDLLAIALWNADKIAPAARGAARIAEAV